MFVFPLNKPSVNLLSAATRRAARRPCGPRTHRAVHRARLYVARLNLRQRATRRTAARRSNQHTPTLSLRARTARRTARRPARPRTHHAIHCAALRVAHLAHVQRRTSRAAIQRRNQNAATLRLRAVAARRTARRPARPSTHHAVHGATLHIASLLTQRSGTPAVNVLATRTLHRAGLHPSSARD